MSDLGGLAASYGLDLIPCSVDFEAGWVLVGRLLFVSPDLSTSDVRELESWVAAEVGPRLRLVT